MSKIFVLAPPEVHERCMTAASDWLAGPSGTMFNDAKSVAKVAVAEYLANEKGFTLYKSVAKYPKAEL